VDDAKFELCVNRLIATLDLASDLLDEHGQEVMHV
jgi:hypothetical protein